jgi:Uma2 family endonuclease
MVLDNTSQPLPSSLDLPDSDDTPVDNELQILIPTLLRSILSLLWQSRQDWFFGINMSLYYQPSEPAIVPDGFLSLGVQRRTSDRGRLSYVLWEENDITPQFVLEVVSRTPGGEYDAKLAKYAEIGVLYYAIYNPNHWQRDSHEPLEVYRLADGKYVRQAGEPVWMSELGLGLGCGQGEYENWQREWLYWFDRDGRRHATVEELARQERERAERLAEILRQQGIDPDQLN